MINFHRYCDEYSLLLRSEFTDESQFKKNTKLLQRRVRWFRDKLVVAIATRGKLKKNKV